LYSLQLFKIYCDKQSGSLTAVCSFYQECGVGVPWSLGFGLESGVSHLKETPTPGPETGKGIYLSLLTLVACMQVSTDVHRFTHLFYTTLIMKSDNSRQNRHCTV